MSSKIAECQELVGEGIEVLFSGTDDFTFVEENPDRAVEWGDVSLWAQHLGNGSKKIYPRRPRLRAWLRTLAANGVGYTAEYENIRYKFIINSVGSGTSSPVSSL